MSYMASYGTTMCFANSNLVPFLWRPVQDQGIMLYKLTKSWHGKYITSVQCYSIQYLTH